MLLLLLLLMIGFSSWKEDSAGERFRWERLDPEICSGSLQDACTRSSRWSIPRDGEDIFEKKNEMWRKLKMNRIG